MIMLEWNLAIRRLKSDSFHSVVHVLGLSAGVVAAGTATLDAALAGLPMVVVYRMNRLSYRIGKLLVDLEHVALPNLIAGKRLVPERIQADYTAEGVADDVARFLERPEETDRLRSSLTDLRASLGGEQAFERAAEAVISELD